MRTGRRFTYCSKVRRIGMSKSPQRNVIRHARIAHRAEKNRVEGAKLREAVVGHHLSRLDVGFAAPVKMRERIVDSEAPARGFEHAQSFGHDFFSNAVAGNHCNLVGFHRYDVCSPVLF